MYNRCLRMAYLHLVKYQKTFLVIVLCGFFVFLVLENNYKSQFLPGTHMKKQAWKTVRSSVKDIKSSISEVKTVVTDMVQGLNVNTINGGDFDELGNMPDMFSNSRKQTNTVLLKDPMYLNKGLEQERSGNSYSFQNETEWDLPKHWLPSWEQKHELAQKEAKHPLNFEADDVLVFLHIQKTSGKTFNSHLVKDMKVPKNIECQCKTLDKPHGCKCMNSEAYIWLFSRLTTAWPCGVHPSWSDLSVECLNRAMDKKEGKTRKRKFTVVTMLRSPYTRYISEWHNVKLDGQWKPYQNLRCYPLTRQTFCYADNWKGVTLDQFLNCSSNPANNRQVRMLADLHMANCLDIFRWLTIPQETGNIDAVNKRYQYVTNNPLLRSAIFNLRNMPFFGLEEYQRESEYLFTRTFGYSFQKHFRQTKTFSEQVLISSSQRESILDLNRLDLVFYRYAKELFFKRLHENVKRKHVFFTDNVDFTTHIPSDSDMIEST